MECEVQRDRKVDGILCGNLICSGDKRHKNAKDVPTWFCKEHQSKYFVSDILLFIFAPHCLLSSLLSFTGEESLQVDQEIFEEEIKVSAEKKLEEDKKAKLKQAEDAKKEEEAKNKKKEEEFIVEAILEDRMTKKGQEFKTKWLGFSTNKDDPSKYFVLFCVYFTIHYCITYTYCYFAI